MITIRQLSHVSLLVSDLESADRFYERILGLKKISRPILDFPGSWYDLGNGQQLHLMAVKPTTAPRTSDLARDQHCSLVVQDYEQAIAFLKQQGVEYRESKSSANHLFIRDPDGNLIELQETVL